MPQSPTERITTVERVVDSHTYRLDFTMTEVDAIDAAYHQLEKEHAELRRTAEREIDELKKWREDVKRRDEEWGSKLWMILPPVLAVLVSNAITYLIALYARK